MAPNRSFPVLLTTKSTAGTKGGLYQTMTLVPFQRGRQMPPYDYPLGPVPRSPSPGHLPLLLVSSLDAPRAMPQHLKEFGSFMDFIPTRLGHNSALDSAVTCLVLAHRGGLPRQPDSERWKRGRNKYPATLCHLKECLDDETDRFSPETLCAILVLRTYEVNLPFSF